MREEVRDVKHTEYKDQREELLVELIAFLRSKELDYGQAFITLKDAQTHLERTSLKNRI